MSEEKAPGLPTVDVNEYGGKIEGERQSMNRRLFMQLMVFSPEPQASEPQTLATRLKREGVRSVIYADTNDPRGFGVLTWSEDPAHFVTKVRPCLEERGGFRPEMTMLGRTYSTGHEPKLAYWLLERPIENVTNPEHDWAIWYPLKRSGAFARVEPHDQSIIMREHAAIGMAYGQAGLAHDIRLACHGIDANDNDFVIGLVGKELHPLSHVVQSMRKTRQTSEFIVHMGPFFVGRVAHRT